MRAALIALSLAAGTAAAAPFAYITNQGSHDVSVVDLATQAVVATVPVGRSPAGVAAASASGRVYVSNPDSKSISVIDMRRQAVVATLPAGLGPVGIDVSPDGRLLAAADWYANRLLVWNTRRPGHAAARGGAGPGAGRGGGVGRRPHRLRGRARRRQRGRGRPANHEKYAAARKWAATRSRCSKTRRASACMR